MPERIQLRRTNGWRMPPNTVKVDRSTKWGNPVSFKPPLDRLYAARAFWNWVTGCKIQRDLNGQPPSVAEIQAALRGREARLVEALAVETYARLRAERGK